MDMEHLISVSKITAQGRTLELWSKVGLSYTEKYSPFENQFLSRYQTLAWTVLLTIGYMQPEPLIMWWMDLSHKIGHARQLSVTKWK